ncbi:MAG: 4Fe-4S binding protein, partial [Faecalibacterium sp.]|nr:4Fe-4S binding protein [Faecalibacterium sp.]
ADDICLIGVPSFGGLVPMPALQRLAAMTGGGAKAVLVAVYGNRAIDDTLTELEDCVKAAGFAVLAGVQAVAHHSLFTQYAVDRPDAEDIAQLREFSAKIEAAAEADGPAPTLPGNRPYKARTPASFIPALQKPASCTHCGSCAARCPMQAITLAPDVTVDAGKCIACMRCFSICPAGAIGPDPEKLAAVSARIAPMFEGRKPNTLFI